MYSKNYSKGVFLNIISKDKNDWKRQVNFINSLLNVNHVEVWIEENIAEPELKFLKSLLKKYEILVHGPFTHLSLISPHKEIREITVKLYLQTLKISEMLEAKLVTFHCGTKLKFTSQEVAPKLLTQHFRKIKKCYKGKIPFTIENLPAEERGVQIHYPTFLLDLIDLKKQISWLNFSLDIGHAFQNGDGLNKISEFLKKYRDSILDIHLQDANLKGKAHLALGAGELDLIKFLKFLRKIQYKGYLTLETITLEDTKFSWEKLFAIEQKLNRQKIL